MSIRRISDLPNYSITGGNQEDNLTQWLPADNTTSVSLAESLIEISEMSTGGNGINTHIYKSKNMTMIDLYNVMTDNILYRDTTLSGSKTFLDTNANFKVDVNNIELTAKNNLNLKINNSNINTASAFSLEVPTYVSSYTQKNNGKKTFYINAEYLTLSSSNLRTNNLNLSGSANINLSSNNINLSAIEDINLTSEVIRLKPKDSANPVILTSYDNIKLASDNNLTVQSGNNLILDVSTPDLTSTNKLELKSKNIYFGDNDANNTPKQLELHEDDKKFILSCNQGYIGFSKTPAPINEGTTYNNIFTSDNVLSNLSKTVGVGSGSYLQLGAKGDIDLLGYGVDIYIAPPGSTDGAGFGIYEVPTDENDKISILVNTFRSDTTNTTHFRFYTDISGTAMRAKWADLAETYASDKIYEPGTLMQFGGSEEVTIATTEVNAVVSTKPAFLMNADISCENTLPLALIGRVPVRVIGSIKKFERIILSDIPGVACNRKFANQQAIGVALEGSDDEGEKLILCSVKLQL